MMALDGRKILVTGASTGIGAAITRAAASRGAHVAAIARRKEPLTRLCRDTGAFPVLADVRDAEAVTAAVRTAAEDLGGLDAVINNAGVFRLGKVSNGVFGDWDDMVRANVLGVLAVSQAAVPHLKAAVAGQIVNISSMSGRRVPGPVSGVYAGTKHAVHALSDGLRQELHEHGIRVTVLAPGSVRTNLGSYITDPDVRQDAADGQLEYGLDPEDVAAQVMHVLTAPPDVHLVEIALMSSRQQPL